MDDLLYRVALSKVPGLGNYRIKMLLETFKTPENVFDASFEDLKVIKGIRETTLKALKEEKAEFLDKAGREIEELQKKGVSLITPVSETYPALLKEIYDPPAVLYVKGKISSEDNFSIAVVGTRSPDGYGKKMTFHFSGQIAKAGYTIVSGMARGVDTIAHKSALKAGGRTIAVLGCGIDVVYPPENLDLTDEISSFGAVISEFPPGTKPMASNFPRRNRIISGISRGVLVVQARKKSGTIHTVNSALEQGRDVFAVPGPVDREISKGTNGLIKEGAKLVESASDIIEEIGEAKVKPVMEDLFSLPVFEQKSPPVDELSGEEKKVFLLCPEGTEGIHIDEIIREINMVPGKVPGILSLLEIKGFIKRLKGNFFVRL